MTPAVRELAVADRAAVVLVVPATGFPVGAYRPVAEQLAGRADVLGVDPPGHGGTEPPSGDPWVAAADAVRRAIEDLRGERPLFVLGHSGGAAAVLEAAQRESLRLAGCYLFEPAVRPAHDGPESPMVERTRRRRSRWESRAEACDYLAGTRPYADFDLRARAAFLEAGMLPDGEGMRLACPPDVEAEYYRAVQRRPVWDRLPEIRDELTVAAGADPAPGSLAAVAPELAARVPGAHFETIPGAGHFAPFENPDQFAARVGDWLSRRGIT